MDSGGGAGSVGTPGGGASPPRGTPAWYSVWRWGAFLWVGGLALLAAVTLGGELVRGGVRPCDRLDQRLCRDLGPAACDVWTNRLHRAGAASTEPRHRRWNKAGRAAADVALHTLLGWDASKADNPTCYQQLEDDIYPVVLAGIRRIVAVAGTRN